MATAFQGYQPQYDQYGQYGQMPQVQKNSNSSSMSTIKKIVIGVLIVALIVILILAFRGTDTALDETPKLVNDSIPIDTSTSSPTTSSPTTSLPTTGYALAPLNAEYRFGPYHMGPPCDGLNKTYEVAGTYHISTSKGACKLLSGKYDAKYDGDDERGYPYPDSTEVICKQYPICRNPPTAESIMIGKYQKDNPRMLGPYVSNSRYFPPAECTRLGGVFNPSEAQRPYTACKFGLYRRKDLPDNFALGPMATGDNHTTPTRQKGATFVQYGPQFMAKKKDCANMMGGWNGTPQSDDSEVDCHLDFYSFTDVNDGNKIGL